MCFMTDNPAADFERYDAEQEEKLSKLPTCTECGDPIQQDDALYINGGFICDECLADLRREVLAEF